MKPFLTILILLTCLEVFSQNDICGVYTWQQEENFGFIEADTLNVNKDGTYTRRTTAWGQDLYCHIDSGKWIIKKNNQVIFAPDFKENRYFFMPSSKEKGYNYDGTVRFLVQCNVKAMIPQITLKLNSDTAQPFKGNPAGEYYGQARCVDRFFIGVQNATSTYLEGDEIIYNTTNKNGSFYKIKIKLTSYHNWRIHKMKFQDGALNSKGKVVSMKYIKINNR